MQQQTYTFRIRFPTLNLQTIFEAEASDSFGGVADHVSKQYGINPKFIEFYINKKKMLNVFKSGREDYCSVEEAYSQGINNGWRESGVAEITATYDRSINDMAA